MRHGNWRWIWVLSPLFRQRAIALNHGNMIGKMYKRRNEVERLFRRLKGFRRIFSRFDKLDVMFIAFINFALIVDGLR